MCFLRALTGLHPDVPSAPPSLSSLIPTANLQLTLTYRLHKNKRPLSGSYTLPFLSPIGSLGLIFPHGDPMGTEPYCSTSLLRATQSEISGRPNTRLATRFHGGILLGVFCPEDGGGMLLRNVGCLLTDYTASCPKSPYSRSDLRQELRPYVCSLYLTVLSAARLAWTG
jgi:hypothetical protein